jgi:aminoglycoside phosphotransferase (APT) family kinase protein
VELVGTGREAEVFAWEDGKVLRLARDPRAAGIVEREAAALAAAHAAGAPVPAVYERVTVDGRPGVVLERLDGTDLLELIRRRPWTLLTVGRTLGRRHAELHAAAGPRELPALREELRHRLGSPLVPEDVRTTALGRLDSLPDGARLLHGDFHPANLLRTRRGDVVIDWTNGARGDPAADVARTLILLGGAIPRDAPLLVRAFVPPLRRVVRESYLRAYGPVDRELVARWRRVWAAARLAEDIPEERGYLLAEARRS